MTKISNLYVVNVEEGELKLTSPNIKNVYQDATYANPQAALLVYLKAVDKIKELMVEAKQHITAMADMEIEERVPILALLTGVIKKAMDIVEEFCLWFSVKQGDDQQDQTLSFFLERFQYVRTQIAAFFIEENVLYCDRAITVLDNIKHNFTLLQQMES